MRSLTQVHRKFISEAYGAWTPLTAEEMKDVDWDTVTRSFRRAYRDLLSIAGGSESNLLYAYNAYKTGSNLYNNLVVVSNNGTLRYMLEDFFNGQITFAADPVRSAGVDPKKGASLVNSFQEILEEFEPYLRAQLKIDPSDAVEDIVKFIDSLPPAAATPFIIVMRSNSSLGGYLFTEVDPKTYGDDIRRAFESPDRREYSAIRVINIFEGLKKEWEIFKSRYDRLTGGRLPGDVSKAVDDFVNLLRLCGENPDFPVDKKYFKEHLLDDSEFIKKHDIDSIDDILDIHKTDPDVGPQSEERIKKYLVYRNLILRPIDSYEIRNLSSRLQRRIGYTNLLRDNRFMSTIAGMIDATVKLLKVNNAVFTQVTLDISSKAGPRASEGFAKFGRILRMMREQPALRDINSLKNLTLPLGFLDTCQGIWQNATEKEKDNVLDIVKEFTEDIEKVAKEEQEKRRKEHPPEAPADADFRPLDDYAFAMDRSDVKLPEEPDNELEATLHKSLKKHFVENNPISFEQADLIINIMRKGYYKDIFHEPEQQWVFRGMGVSDKWLREFIGVGPGETLPKKASRTGNFTLKPREGQGSTSWSILREKALTFSETADHKIILIASSRENPLKFVTSPGGLYKVDGFTEHEHEAEVIGLGPIKVSRIFWKSSYDYESMVLTTPEEEP